MKRCFLPAAAILILAAGSWLSAQTSGPDTPFRVELKRIDGVLSGVGDGFYFEADMVAETMNKFPVKLPQPMPPDSKLGYFYGGPIWAVLQKTPDPAKVLLTMDANANFDLTDDKAVELGLAKKWDDGVVVKFARPFEKPRARTDWLPYRINYNVYKDRDGKGTDQVNISSDYHFKGDFRLHGKDYELVLEDGDSRGRFIREKLVNVFLQIKEKDSKEPARGRRFFELIPIADALYEVIAFAEDGSWIEFVKSTLPMVALGKPFADMELTDTTGRTFKLSDYKNTLILLDFWPSWCVPCVAQFDEIKKTLAQYKDRPLTVLGINIDEAARLEKARTIVAEKQLTWPQIMDGKGEFIPIYQVYGRLPERENSFPIYAAIDRKGIVRYATNAWNNMAGFLSAELKDEEKGTDDLFIPLSSGAGMKILLSDPIDFTPAIVREFIETHPPKLPLNLVAEAKVGLMSNDALAVLIPGTKAEIYNLVVDTDRDFDLIEEKSLEIPFFQKPDVDQKEAKDIRITTSFQNGGKSFGPFSFFARPAKDKEMPEIVFFGWQRNFAGSFFAGDREYRVTVTDPTPDNIITERDWTRPGVLKVSEKRGGEWVEIHDGRSRIPIGGRLYRLRRISDDGALCELEPEK